MVAPFLPDEEKVAAIRDALPATGAGIYLDTATAGPLPVETDRAMREWADWELRVGRIADEATEEYAARSDEARGTLAAVLVAPVERVVLAPSVGSAFGALAGARRWHPGERVVTLSSLQPAVRRALSDVAATVGAASVELEVPPGAPTSQTLDVIGRATSDAAAIVALPHVSTLDGSLVPIREATVLAHRAGAALFVDGSLAVGAIEVDGPGSAADVYATAGDRWLCGPSGTAAAFVAPDRAIPGSLSGEGSAADRAELHRAAVVGLGRSAGWLAMQVGLEWAFARTRALVELAARSLADVDPLELLAPADRVAATLAFRVAGWPADRLRAELGRRAFALVGLVAEADAVRVSVGCWNTEDEIERFVGAVRELAAISPEDAARRRPPLLVVPGDRS